MITLLFATPEDLPNEDCESFCAQNINMDDWDYMVLLEDPDSLLAPADEYDRDDECAEPYQCHDWNVDRLLGPLGKSDWYRGLFKGKTYPIGIRYHA